MRCSPRVPRRGEVDLKLELADAINTELRIRTNANSLILEGTQDTPEFKKLWGPRPLWSAG